MASGISIRAADQVFGAGAIARLPSPLSLKLPCVSLVILTPGASVKATIVCGGGRRAAGGSAFLLTTEPLDGGDPLAGVAGVGGVRLDLLAQVLHVCVDRALVAFVLVALHVVDQLEARVDAAGIAGERDEQLVLVRGELDQLPVTDKSLKPLDSAELAYLQFTSGSTRFPALVEQNEVDFAGNESKPLWPAIAPTILRSHDEKSIHWQKVSPFLCLRSERAA